MDRVKNVTLVLLWALLAYRVYSLIASSEYDKGDLIILALFSWLGGIVTGKLMDKAYMLMSEVYHERRSSSGRV